SLHTDTPPTPIYTLSLHDALPISHDDGHSREHAFDPAGRARKPDWYVDRVVRLLPVQHGGRARVQQAVFPDLRSVRRHAAGLQRSEEHTSELQSRGHLVCRLLLEK